MRLVKQSPQVKTSPLREGPSSLARIAGILNAEATDLHGTALRALSNRRIPGLALYCAAFVSLHGITNFYPLARLAATPWSPETGLTVAASVLLGWMVIPLAMMSHIIADWTTRGAPFLTVEFPASLLYALAYAGPGTLVRQWLQAFGHESMRFLLRFIALTMSAAFIFAGTQTGLAVLIRQIPLAELLSPAFTLAVGDIIGILTVAPVFLLALQEDDVIDYLRRHIVTLVSGGLAIVLISLFVFGLDSTDDFKFFYLLFVPVVALAVILGLSGAIVSVLITDASMMAIIYWREISPSTATELQLLMISLSVTGLVLGTTVHERGIFKRALTLSQERLSESQSLLLHSSRVAVVSEMATALAHELNQPLSAIKTYLRTIQRVLGRGGADPAKLQQLLDETVAQVDHAGSLISKTRKFLRRGATPIQKSNLRHIISTSMALMEAELRSAHIETSMHLPKAMPSVWASEIQIQQVIINLLRNAKEAVGAKTAGERTITISAGPAAEPGYMKISIMDSGMGVPSEVRDRLVQPFATSKRDGLGLGLALCRSILATHGGEIWFDQDVTNATCFAFTLRTA
jgi:two-component system, LuxR family, sensor kinase FixL